MNPYSSARTVRPDGRREAELRSITGSTEFWWALWPRISHPAAGGEQSASQCDSDGKDRFEKARLAEQLDRIESKLVETLCRVKSIKTRQSKLMELQGLEPMHFASSYSRSRSSDIIEG